MASKGKGKGKNVNLDLNGEKQGTKKFEGAIDS